VVLKIESHRAVELNGHMFADIDVTSCGS